jgi:hypothetical protein
VARRAFFCNRKLLALYHPAGLCVRGHALSVGGREAPVRTEPLPTTLSLTTENCRLTAPHSIDDPIQ